MTFYFTLNNKNSIKPKPPPKPILIKYTQSKYRQKRAIYLCQGCNTEFEAYVSKVNKGDTRSCGCYGIALTIFRSRTHGHSRTKSKTYKTWDSMKQRCNNVRDKDYINYGARGIKICKEWYDFEKFLKDMGERPKNMTIDRIDNDKGYYKENCRWATFGEQLLNRRVTKRIEYEGELVSLKKLHIESGSTVSYGTVRGRIRIGWSVQDALFK